jgi:uncharacterized protein YpmB
MILEKEKALKRVILMRYGRERPKPLYEIIYKTLN